MNKYRNPIKRHIIDEAPILLGGPQVMRITLNGIFRAKAGVPDNFEHRDMGLIDGFYVSEWVKVA